MDIGQSIDLFVDIGQSINLLVDIGKGLGGDIVTDVCTTEITMKCPVIKSGWN